MPNKFNLVLWNLLVSWLILASAAQAASFDCKKTHLTIENLICNSPTISVLDDALGNVYKGLMGKFSDSQKSQLRGAQKLWLQSIRDVCTDDDCLKKVYLLRLNTLSAISTELSKNTQDITSMITPQFESVKMQASQLALNNIQNLFNGQNQQLKAMRKNAKDILFDSEPEANSKSAYCKSFWRALDVQEKFDTPSPDMVIFDSATKDALFEVMYAAGRNNYLRFLAQKGKLTPSTYRYADFDWNLGPSTKGEAHYLQKLKNRFDTNWIQSDFLEPNDNNLLENVKADHLLYMQPYPVKGYARPLLISIVKDTCEKCDGISMAIRIVSVDGLLHPDELSSDRPYISQGTYADSIKVAEKRHTTMPVGPFLLMGLGIFDEQLTFWTLDEHSCVEPNAREIDEIIGIDNPIPPCANYQITTYPLFDNPGYSGPQVSCNIGFN